MTTRLMWRAAVVVALLVQGCSRIDPSKALRYQCDRADPTSACPGGWVCTLDRFCADPEVGIEVSCRVPEDCPGGWLCALTGECVDPGVGRPLPCDEAADCPGQWKCSLIGQCVDPADPAPWPCESSDDCTGGWHCGVGGVCYERTQAKAVPCRLDAGVDDCAPTWRCGLDARCHERDVGAPLPCQVDADCEAQWRCDAEQRCADVSLDALRDTADAGPTGWREEPPVLPRRVSALGVSDDQIVTFATGNGDAVRLIAWATDGGLSTAVVGVDRFADFGADLDGGPLPSVFLASMPVTEPTTALAVFGTTVWRATTSAVEQWTWVESLPPALALTRRYQLTFTPTDLRLLSGASVAAFDLRHLSVLVPTVAYDGGVVAPALSDGANDNGITGVGYFPWAHRPTSVAPPLNGPSVVAFREQGTWLAPFNGRDVPQGFQRGKIVRGEARALRAVAWDEFTETGLGVTESDAGIFFVELSGAPDTEEPTADRIGLTVTTGQVLASSRSLRAACEGRYESFHAGAMRDGGGTWFSLGCTQGDGGQAVQRGQWFGSRVEGALLPLQEGWIESEERVGHHAAAANGQLWVDTDEEYTLDAVTASGVATSSGGTAAEPALVLGAELIDPEGCGVGSAGIDCDRRVRATTCSRAGTASLWCSGGQVEIPTVFVAGRPDWQFFDLRALPIVRQAPFVLMRVHPGRRSIEQVLGTAPDLGTQVVATAVSTPDAGTHVMIGAADRLYWGDLSSPVSTGNPQLDLQAPSPFRFATTPLPGGAITSLAPLPVDLGASGARFGEGFLVVTGRLYRYSADNPVVWRSTELPIGAAEAVEVWADGRRARALLRDGTVYGLPSRVQLSAPLSAGASSVLQVATPCGHVFALTANALYWLEAASGALAQWRPVDVGGETQLLDGRLIAGPGGELLLYLPEGRSRVVTGFRCLGG